MHPRTFALLSLWLLIVPGLAAAQSWEGTTSVEAVADNRLVEGQELTPGQEIFLVANVTPPAENGTAYRAFLNGTLDGAPVDGVMSLSNGDPMTLPIQLSAPNTTGDTTLTWTLTVQRKNTTAGGNATGNQTDNGTQANATATWTTVEGFPQPGEASFRVAALEAPTQPGAPWDWILGIGAVVLIAGGTAAFWWINRDTQIRGRARSQAMRDLEGETFEQEEPDEPEVHPQLTILEARAQDVRRMIELARERHESGDLTAHQYEMLRDRKEAELEEIQEEMDDYRS